MGNLRGEIIFRSNKQQESKFMEKVQKGRWKKKPFQKVAKNELKTSGMRIHIQNCFKSMPIVKFVCNVRMSDFVGQLSNFLWLSGEKSLSLG